MLVQSVVPLIALGLFISCSYKARLVWYRDAWPKKITAVFWWGVCASCVALAVASGMSPRF